MYPERPRRIPASEIAVLTVLPERKIRMMCRVIDFSHSGMGLLCEAELHPAAEVLIEMDGCIVSGEVRHCKELASEHFRAGVQLDQALAMPENPATPVRHIYKMGA